MQTNTIEAGNTESQPFQGQNVVIIGGSSAIGGATQIVADIATAQPAIFADIGRIDHLLITAGTARLLPLKDQSEADLMQVMRERLIGPLLTVKAALPLLHAGSSITLTSAQLASRPLGIGTIMAAAVSAVESTVRALAVELSPIRVNAVSPGMVDTPLLDGLMGDAKRQVLEQTALTLPTRNVGRPEDIAQAILFLMANRFVTGEVLHVDKVIQAHTSFHGRIRRSSCSQCSPGALRLPGPYQTLSSRNVSLISLRKRP